jgi:hypothetical protein
VALLIEIKSITFEGVLVSKLKKRVNRKGFKLGSQMDRSTDEGDVMSLEGRILGKY